MCIRGIYIIFKYLLIIQRQAFHLNPPVDCQDFLFSLLVMLGKISGNAGILQYLCLGITSGILSELYMVWEIKQILDFLMTSL